MSRIHTLEAIPAPGTRCVFIAPPVYHEEGSNYGRSALPGLLFVATIATRNTCEVQVVDLQHLHSRHDLLQALLEIEDADYYGITNVAFSTFVSALDIAAVIRQTRPDARIVIGGCHIGLLPKDIEFPEYFEIAYGFVPFQNSIAPLKNTELRYDLWPDVSSTRYAFLFDVGCDLLCTYCVHPRQYFRDPDVVEHELQWALNKGILSRPYHLGTYDFASCIEFYVDALQIMKSAGSIYQTQARPDRLADVDDDLINLAKQSGLVSLALGTESINHDQLLRYRKTTDPEQWVHDTLSSLQRLKRFDILAKINIIVFDDSTQETLNILYEFLDKNRNFISGVSASPLMAFPGTRLYRNAKRAELNLLDEEYFRKRHVYPVHLSDDVTYYEALEFCKMISNEFTTDAYLDLAKAFYTDDVVGVFSK